MAEDKRKMYDVVLKIEIAEYYLQNKDQGMSVRDVARKFSLQSHSCILDWAKKINILRAQKPSSKKIKPNDFTTYPF